MGEPVEYLIVVDADSGGGLESLGGLVVQAASDRLGVVRGDRATLARLRDRPDVIALAESDLPADVAARLDDTERLFADAWAQHGRPKQRRGEGLPWDAPGYLPPDP